MLVDIILLIFVILILYVIYLNKINKEHMISRNEQLYMYTQEEPELLKNYYNMINDKTISQEEKCHNNNIVITEMMNNSTLSPKILNLAKQYKGENCLNLQKDDLENMHILGDKNPIKIGNFEYSLKDNNKNEPILIRINKELPNDKPFETNASLIIKVMNNVYSFNTQNNKWHVDKGISWNMVIDDKIISKLNYFVNEFLILRTKLNKNGKKLTNIIPIFHLNNDLFPIKKIINLQDYEFSIINGKLIISNKTNLSIESKEHDALVLLLLNDNIYLLSKSYNWMLIDNTKLKSINNTTTLNQLNNIYNSLINRKTLMNNIEEPNNIQYDNLYYTIFDNMPLNIQNKLYNIEKKTNLIVKSDINNNNFKTIKLIFNTMFVFNNNIYFKTITGNWVNDISKDSILKFRILSNKEENIVNKELLNYLQEIKEHNNNYYKAGDKTPFKYKSYNLKLQNGYFIKDTDNQLYVKFHTQDYLKFNDLHKYDLIPPEKLKDIKNRLDKLVNKYENFRILGKQYYKFENNDIQEHFSMQEDELQRNQQNTNNILQRTQSPRLQRNQQNTNNNIFQRTQSPRLQRNQQNTNNNIFQRTQSPTLQRNQQNTNNNIFQRTQSPTLQRNQQNTNNNIFQRTQSPTLQRIQQNTNNNIFQRTQSPRLHRNQQNTNNIFQRFRSPTSDNRLNRISQINKSWLINIEQRNLENNNELNLIILNNNKYKIKNNTIEKNGVPFTTIFTVLVNKNNILYAKTVDGKWYQELNESLKPLPENVYDTLNMFLVRAISIRNMGVQLQIKQQVPNLNTCSQSMECLNKNAYCREGNNLCMYDDECNFMYRDRPLNERLELCKKMSKNLEWFTLKDDSPTLLFTISKDRLLTKLPNSIFNNNTIKLCAGKTINKTDGCITVNGSHNVYIILNNLKQLSLKSNDKGNHPGFVRISKVNEQTFNITIYSWSSKSPLSDPINRTEIFKTIKNKSINNINIQNSKYVDLMLFSI